MRDLLEEFCLRIRFKVLRIEYGLFEFDGRNFADI